MTPSEAAGWVYHYALGLWLSLGGRECTWPSGSPSEVESYRHALIIGRLDIARDHARGPRWWMSRSRYERGLAYFVLRLLTCIEAAPAQACATCRHWVPQETRLGQCLVAEGMGLRGQWYHLSNCDSPPYVRHLGSPNMWEPVPS